MGLDGDLLVIVKDENEQLSVGHAKASGSVACGVIMPISSAGECTEAHWSDVLSIISDAVESAGFRADLVSNADEVSIIQRTIVQNIYNSPIVVCDVSEKNANVMFELGLRLAFDKPTIIIKDDKTSYSFDTGVIEHLEYPRDLRFNKIVEFKKRLSEKVLATYDKKQADPNYSTFLRHFGQFKLAKLEETEVGGQEFIVKQLEEIRRSVDKIRATPGGLRTRAEILDDDEIDICCGPMSSKSVEKFKNELDCDTRIERSRVGTVGSHLHVYAKVSSDYLEDMRQISTEIRALARSYNKMKVSKQIV